MIWFLRDFDLLVVVLHAAALSFEALLLGGIFFSFLIARDSLGLAAGNACSRLVQWSAAGLIGAELLTMVITCATMLTGTGLSFRDLLSASFLHAEALTVLFALLLGLCARRGFVSRLPWIDVTILLSGLGILSSIVFLSHAVSQMQHRLLLATLTGLHHVGTAAWIGAMPYLLLSLRGTEDNPRAESMVRRFSAMALIGVPVLIGAGIGMAWFYVASVQGLYGSSYGLMLLAKIYLLSLMLTLGAGNWYLLRRAGSLPTPVLARLRRFSEAEIGLGFTVLLAAASLTSQSPASDLQTSDLVTPHAFYQRMKPEWPRLHSPSFSALAPPTSIRQGVEDHQFSGGNVNDKIDDAWSEYNHHWAGIMVLAAGLLALLSSFSRRHPGLRWARYWPFSFAGLAVFIVLRADPEAWPLGPRPFWASFSYPDVLEHRLEALLIVLFAAFESSVQAGRLRKTWASCVFPLVCALGAALLLTHSHGLGDPTAEVLAEVSHTAIAVLGATAAWSRWLELRVVPGRQQRIAGTVWPVALMLVGLVLLNYRES